MARTIEQIEAEMEKLREEKRSVMQADIAKHKRQARESLMFLHEAGALSKGMTEALTDKRGQFAVNKFFPERE